VLSQPAHIATWFSDEADLEPVPGARGVLVCRTAEARPTKVEVTVVTADRPRLFAFRWVFPERQRAEPTATGAVLVEFRITAAPGGTRLVVSESGLDAVDWDDSAKASYAAGHTEGWEVFLPRLRSYAEGLVTQGSA